MLPTFERPQFRNDGTIDSQLGRFVSSLGRLLDLVTGNRELDYVDIDTTKLTGGADVKVAHKLNRKPVGWRVTDIDAAATVYRSAAFDSMFLTLHASATCNVKLRVW